MSANPIDLTDCSCEPYEDDLCDVCEQVLFDLKTGKTDAQRKRSSGFLDMRPGNGSLKASRVYTDYIAYEANDGRSQNRTTFNPHDVDGEQWTRLYRHQEGVGEPSRATENHRADIRRFTQTVCGQLGLPRWVTEESVRIANEMDYSLFGSHSYEKVVLGIISRVSDQEMTRTVRPEDFEPGMVLAQQDEFQAFMDAVDMDAGDLRSIRASLGKTEFF